MLRNPSRPLVLALAASLFLSSLPASAAGAIGRAAPVARTNAGAGVAAVGVVRMSPAVLAPASLTFAAPSSGQGFTAAPLLTPAPGAPARAAFSAADAPAAPRAVTAAAVAPIARISAAPAVAPVAAKPATVIAGVEAAFTRLQAAQKNGPAASATVLDKVYEGFERGADDGSLTVSGRVAEADASRLSPSSARMAAPADGPRWVFHGKKQAQGPTPKSSLQRSIDIGFIAAVVPLVITFAVTITASVLGYEFNSNYGDPTEGMGATPSLLQSGVFLLSAAVMAPVAEEIFFRAGLQGGLAKVTKFLRMGSFWIPATLVSLLFVAVHETSDPVLFATRFIHAMILAYAFKKEGLLASIAAHGFFNGILTLPILLSAVVGALSPDVMIANLLSLGLLTALGIGALLMLVKAILRLNAQRNDVKSGALSPKAFTPLHGVIALAVMAFGYFMLMPNPYWLLGMFAIVPWLAYKAIKR